MAMRSLDNEQMNVKERKYSRRSHDYKRKLWLYEARYRNLFNNREELISHWRPDLTLSLANQAYARFYEKPLKHMIGQPLLQSVHPEDAKKVSHHFEKIGKNLQPAKIEYRVAVGGNIRWVSSEDTAILDQEGNLLEYHSIGMDISYQKDVDIDLPKSRDIRRIDVDGKQKRLDKTSEMLQTIIDAIPVIICYYDEWGRVKLINKACERLLGWNLETIGEKYSITYYPQDRLIKTPETLWEEMKIRRQDGSYLVCSWANVWLADNSRISIGIDLTDRIRTENILQEMSRITLKTLENERQAVAKELHDGIGASLAAIKFALEGKLETMTPNANPDGMSIEKIIVHLQNTIKETKRISSRLRPATLDELGLLSTITAHLREFSDFYPDITVTHHIDIAEEQIPDLLKVVLYRILQEAINNVGKHSGASELNIKLYEDKKSIVLTVDDNGFGFDINKQIQREDPLYGLGLKSMRERAEICAGKFEINSQQGGGCHIRVTLPAIN